MSRELVLPPDYSVYAWEIKDKGVLDTYVLVDDLPVSVSFFDPVRLQQEIADDLEQGRHFTVKRLLVVERVTLQNMQLAVSEAPPEFFD